METVTEGILSNENSWKWKSFSFIFSDSSQLLSAKAVFSSARTYCSANPSFRLVNMRFLSTGNSIFLFQVSFCRWKILLKFGGSQVLKTNHIAAGGHQFLVCFFQIFFKVETPCPYNKSSFFNILYPASANECSAYENSIFLVRSTLLLSEIISVIERWW